jgi:beta-lactamase regulating signal transducer with metallopeptidase domain
MKEMFELLFSVTLSTNVFIIATLILRFLFKNSSKNSRLFLWFLVGIKLILPFNIKSNFSLIPEEIIEKSTQSASGIVGDVVRSGTYVNESLFDSKLIFLCIWATVSLIILIYGAVSFWRLHKNIGDAIKMKGNIFQSEKVVSPFVLGVIKPKIYIPFNLDDETLSHIVSHEKSHIKSFDNITKLVAFILLAVHWCNPLVWVCFKLLSQDIEFACDERVVKNYTLEKRKSYAEALLSCAVNEGRGLIHPLAFGEVSIKDRIKAVVSYKKTLKIVLALFLCVATVSFVLFATVPEVSAKNEAKEKAITEEKVIEQTVPEETTTEVFQEETTTEPVTESYQEYYNDPYYEENVEFHEDEGEYQNTTELIIDMQDMLEEYRYRINYHFIHGEYPPETTVFDKNNLPPVDGILVGNGFLDSGDEEIVPDFNLADLDELN